jgi:hypothetical protein
VIGAFEGGIQAMLAVSYLLAALVLPTLGVRWLYALGGFSGLGAAFVLLRLLGFVKARDPRETTTEPVAAEAPTAEPVAAEAQTALEPAGSPALADPE